ncbi:MAG: beta-ketoacyl-ACP synthase II [Bacteroidales bacterium]|jgi:3-oxoacyl-[acyl-carrier-protein] synthase II|nr:beta-ketoacyl-ACP synthase II [Bacteroidales bacterium]MBR3065275.1 beta-ketoacyl-ACP synthase II [Bacteroidales bacterium]
MKRVVITGLGCISPLGNSVDAMWSGLLDGHCAIDFIQSIDTADLPVKVGAEVKDFRPEDYGLDRAMIRHNDRYALYALAAATQAMRDSGLEVGKDVDSSRLGCAIGSGVGGIQTFCREHSSLLAEGARGVSPLFIPEMIANIASGNVAILFHAEGPNLPVVTACATGTHSIGEAYRMIREGRADAMITGGTEAALCPIAIAGFANSKALTTSEDPNAASLPFDSRRKGFVIGEGSGIMILEDYEIARRRGAHIYAEVCGYGNSCDAYHYTAPRADAKSATNCIKWALEEAGYKEGEKLYINAHGTGTPLNDKAETLAIKQALGETAARQAVISSTKSMMGHMLGATGAVELVICAKTLQDGKVAPTIHLDSPDPDCDLDYTPHTARDFAAGLTISNSFGFGGQNACVALRKI